MKLRILDLPNDITAHTCDMDDDLMCVAPLRLQKHDMDPLNAC